VEIEVGMIQKSNIQERTSYKGEPTTTSDTSQRPMSDTSQRPTSDTSQCPTSDTSQHPTSLIHHNINVSSEYQYMKAYQ
jgi:hypothetical protein